MKIATLAACLLVLTAGCIVQTGEPDPETVTPSTPERIDEEAETPPQPKTASAPEYDVQITKIENLVHQKMNERRVANGLDPLNRSEELESIARYKSWDMAQRDYFGHRGPSGQNELDLRQRFSASCPDIGQNIYKRNIGGGEKRVQSQLNDENKLATQAVNALMNSTGHRKNILNPAYEVQGIGVFVDKNGTVYLTQEFCG